MARIDIDNFIKIEKKRSMVHDIVCATYTVFEQNGCRYLQIDTYGRDVREKPDKVSQSIQIDKETAMYIVELLQKEFDF